MLNKKLNTKAKTSLSNFPRIILEQNNWRDCAKENVFLIANIRFINQDIRFSELRNTI